MAQAKRARLNAGDVVAGRYRIDGVVGKGGFGAVYRATQMDTLTPVALKVLLKNLSTAAVDSKRFKREAALVQRLRHPNIVQLLDFGTTERSEPFIAFELLEGQSLNRVLKAEGRMASSRAAAILRDVVTALAAAHEFGVIHRDIKPGNVFLLDGEVVAKVLDFGIAKAVSGAEAGGTQLTEAGQMIGTPHYMAPEQVRGTGVVPATDVYALGLVAAEMIAGRRVVGGQALIDVYMTHIDEAPLPFDPLVKSSPLWPVIERATKKDLGERYASAAEMLEELRPVLRSLSLEVPGSAAEPPEDPLARTTAYEDEAPTAARRGASAPADVPVGSGTLLMDDQSHAAAERIREAVGAAPPESGPPSSLLEATVDMSDVELADVMGSGASAPTGAGEPAPRSDELTTERTGKSAAAASGEQPGARGSSPSHAAWAQSGEHAWAQSGEHAWAQSGEHAWVQSGEHAFTQSGERAIQRPSPAPPGASVGASGEAAAVAGAGDRPGRGRPIAWILVVLVLAAAVAAALVFVGPWKM